MDMGIAGFAVEDARDFQDLLNKKNSYDWDYIDESLMELEQIETNITFYLEDGAEYNRTLEQLENILEELKSDKSFEYGRLELVVKRVDDSDWKDKLERIFQACKNY